MILWVVGSFTFNGKKFLLIILSKVFIRGCYIKTIVTPLAPLVVSSRSLENLTFPISLPISFSRYSF